MRYLSSRSCRGNAFGVLENARCTIVPTFYLSGTDTLVRGCDLIDIIFTV